MLLVEDTALAVIDLQGNLVNLVHEHDRILKHTQYLIKACQVFGLPLLWSEQAPNKIGETVLPIKELLFPLLKPIHKRSFSCLGAVEYLEQLASTRRRQILIAGIETHVCVYQTASDLKRHGYEVHVIADAVSSRHQIDHDMAINRMRQEGIIITTAEMAMCELLKTADNPKFKEIMTYIKRV